MGKRRRGKNPNSWQLRYYEGSGLERRETFVTFHGTAREADARLAKLNALARSGRATGNRGRTNFAVFCEEWLTYRETLVFGRDDDELAPDTTKADASRVRKQIIPVLGTYRIDQIGPREIEAAKRVWKTAPSLTRAHAPLSGKSVANIYGNLKRILNDAVRWNYLEYNPCDRVTSPPVKTRKLVATPLEDARKLLEYPSLAPVHVCCLTALFTGLRRGELLGLRVEDVDLDQGTVWCERSLTIHHKTLVHKDVKTHNDRGRRLQALSPMIHALLAAYLEANPGMTGPLFCARGTDERWRPGRKAWTPSAYSSAERIHLRRVGIDTSAQRLRHAFNALSGAAGVDLALRAVLMGHSSTKLTETTYQTVWLAQKRAAVGQLEALLRTGQD
jgi:integrase